jgi:hypothetical protein
VESIRRQLIFVLTDAKEQLAKGFNLTLPDGREVFVRGAFLCVSADLPALAKVGGDLHTSLVFFLIFLLRLLLLFLLLLRLLLVQMIGLPGHMSLCPCCFCQLQVRKVAKAAYPVPGYMDRPEAATDGQARSSLFYEPNQEEPSLRDGHCMKEWHDRLLQAPQKLQEAMRQGPSSAGGLVSVFGAAYVDLVFVEYGHAMGVYLTINMFSKL